jgi:transposase-like protein
MGEAEKRKVHTAEFKAKVGLEAVRGGKTITEIAHAYGVHPQLVGQWTKEILGSAGALFQTRRGPKPAEDKSGEDRLYGKAGRLKMEVSGLKKLGVGALMRGLTGSMAPTSCP